MNGLECEFLVSEFGSHCRIKTAMEDDELWRTVCLIAKKIDSGKNGISFCKETFLQGKPFSICKGSFMVRLLKPKEEIPILIIAADTKSKKKTKKFGKDLKKNGRKLKKVMDSLGFQMTDLNRLRCFNN